jgi:hypothetical protein
MTVRADIVAILVGSDPRTIIPSRGEPYAPRHRDGRPLTAAEIELVMQASIEELEAAGRYLTAVADHAVWQHETVGRACALIKPYFARLPADATVDDARALMPRPTRDEFDRLAEAAWPGGTVVLPFS